MKNYQDYIKESDDTILNDIILDDVSLIIEKEIEEYEEMCDKYRLGMNKILLEGKRQLFENIPHLLFVDGDRYVDKDDDIKSIDSKTTDIQYKIGYAQTLNYEPEDIASFGKFETWGYMMDYVKENKVNMLKEYNMSHMHRESYYFEQYSGDLKKYLETDEFQSYHLENFGGELKEMTKELEDVHGAEWTDKMKTKYSWVFDSEELGII